MDGRRRPHPVPGKDDPFTHSIKYGEGYGHRLQAQWQGGKQIAIWPSKIANGQVILPAAVKAPRAER